MNWIELLGLFSGICTSVSTLPQLIKTIKEKKSGEISMLMLVALLVGVSGWIVYGFLREDIPIIVTNIFSLLLNIVMTYFGLKYKEHK